MWMAAEKLPEREELSSAFHSLRGTGPREARVISVGFGPAGGTDSARRAEAVQFCEVRDGLSEGAGECGGWPLIASLIEPRICSPSMITGSIGAPTVRRKTVNPASNSEPTDGHGQRWYAEEVRPHEPALRAWLRSRFPWLADVDNIVQESVIRLWRRFENRTGAPIHSPKAALFAIARNAAVDQARRNAVVSIEPVADLGSLTVLDSTDTVEAISARQELGYLADAIRQLPTRCRQVLTLTKVYGLTERETAERLGISEHTVRTQVVRGMERCTNYFRSRGITRP
jgi:RNA polymerase sigma factor (sigma-70 family)